MATVQSQIQFSVRKKRYNITKEKSGKENSNLNNIKSSVKINSGKGDDHLLKKNAKNSRANDENADDSDVECIFTSLHPRRTPRKKNTKCSRVLQLSDSDSEDEDNILLSPPKRGCTAVNDTRVATNEVSSTATPSHLISRLHLKTPTSKKSTDEHENESHLPPKRLFSTESAFQQVRQALQSSDSTSMPGREEHINKLHSFLELHLSNNSSGTLYISGPPGTGKTACLSKIMDVPQFKSGYKIINLNCTSIKSSGSIYARIAQELSLKITKKTERECLSAIEKYLRTNHKMTLLVLDEIDQLDSRKQSVLYTVFEWPSKPNSRIVLIGIANALDLTDRILPRLQARLDLKPSLLHFPPYNKQQIVNILSERITQSEVSSLFPHAALQLLAAKVASTCGDVRRALDIARRVVEIAEFERSQTSLPLQQTMENALNRLCPMKSPLKNSDGGVKSLNDRNSPRKLCEIGNLSPTKSPRKISNVENLSSTKSARKIFDIGGLSPKKSPWKLSEARNISPLKSPQKCLDIGSISPRKSPRKNPPIGNVTMKNVMTVLNSVYGVSQSLSTDCDECFPLQQKILVASLLLMIKKGRSKDVTIGKLHDVYRRVCKKKNLTAVDQAEFLSLCQLVETRGILRLHGRKEARLFKISLQWDEEEVSSALKDKQLLSSILNDTSCL